MKKGIDEVIASIPQWRSAAIRHEPLKGGFTNDTYKVEVDGMTYVVRVNGAQARHLGLSRALEVDAVEAAAARGLAPKVFRLGDPDEVLVTEYLPGGSVPPEEAHYGAFMAELCALLKEVHAMEGPPRANDPFAMIERYVVAAEKLGSGRPEGFDPHLARMRELAAGWDGGEKRYCHNDVFTHNLIRSGGKLKAIDWELSGTGDVYFELATVAYGCHYSAAEEIMLLEAYFGADEVHAADGGHLRKLRAMRYVGLIREVAWAMLMSAIVVDPVNHDMDFKGFQASMVGRLDEVAFALVP